MVNKGRCFLVDGGFAEPGTGDVKDRGVGRGGVMTDGIGAGVGAGGADDGGGYLR